MRRALLLLAALVLGCSAKQVFVEPESNLAESKSKVALDVAGPAVERSVVDDLRRHLGGGLIIAGFELAGTPPPPESITLDVDVEKFTPGSAATRLIVGFGAGRGSLIYRARYLAPDGSVLAEMAGQERFTGGEPHFNTRYGQLSTLGGAEKVQYVLVQEAARHIIELGTGELEKTDP